MKDKDAEKAVKIISCKCSIKGPCDGGYVVFHCDDPEGGKINIEKLLQEVRAEEREECAKVAKEYRTSVWTAPGFEKDNISDEMAEEMCNNTSEAIAQAIRERK